MPHSNIYDFGSKSSGSAGNGSVKDTNLFHSEALDKMNALLGGTANQGSSLGNFMSNAQPVDTRGGAHGWEARADQNVSSGLGNSNPYEATMEDYINNDPATAPDYHKNWVNDGGPQEFANFHGRPVTNQWARYGDAFNNTRWWDPGQEAIAGAEGAGVTQTGQYGQGKRWEPIDTQELRAQKRAEDYEEMTRNLGMQRQHKYAQGPYDMMTQHQQTQMGTDYWLDKQKAQWKVALEELVTKAEQLNSATGIYARALYGLMGVGGMVLNPYDEQQYRMMSDVVNKGRAQGWSAATINERCKNILLNAVQYHAEATGQGVGMTLESMRKAMGDADWSSMIDLLGGSIGTLMNGGGLRF